MGVTCIDLSQSTVTEHTKGDISGEIHGRFILCKFPVNQLSVKTKNNVSWSCLTMQGCVLSQNYPEMF